MLEHSSRPDPPVSTIGMPMEMEYAVDTYLLEEEPLDILLPVATAQLKAADLLIGLDWIYLTKHIQLLRSAIIHIQNGLHFPMYISIHINK